MRKHTVLAALLLGLLACSQPNNSSASGAVETQANYIARCTAETLAANPDSRNWAADNCASNWQMVEAAGPMAEAILAAAPATGASANAAGLPGLLPMIQWSGAPEGTLAAQGQLGDVEVQLERTPSLNFYWDETGAFIPYDVVGALQGRGAEVTMIGCSQIGVGEMSKAYRVTAPGHAPFGLGVYDRSAPTANADSFYNVSTDLTGQIKTIAELRRDGSEWAEACPY
jgi:hypothetical protein